MATKSKAIDQYIGKSQEFAKPVLLHFRELVHKVCPDVEEKIKWSFPHFDYKGQMLCSMAAFKNHCAIGFWKASLIDEKLVEKAKTEEAMGHLGKVTALKDLPSDKILTAYIKAGMKLNEAGISVKKPAAAVKKEIVIHPALSTAIKKNKKAGVTWQKFSDAHKREYTEWINEAKTDVTRNRRIDTTIEWLSEGKSRNWKYK